MARADEAMYDAKRSKKQHGVVSRNLLQQEEVGPK
jgi:hypothetical protein